MKYRGDLYGRIGRKYFPLEMTSEDIDKKDQQIAKLQAALELMIRDMSDVVDAIQTYPELTSYSFSKKILDSYFICPQKNNQITQEK